MMTHLKGMRGSGLLDPRLFFGAALKRLLKKSSRLPVMRRDSRPISALPRSIAGRLDLDRGPLASLTA